MPLNTNIYAQFAPQAKTTQDYLDEYDARDMRDQQNKLNALGLQEKQRGIEDNNRLRDLYAQPGFDPNSDAGIQAVGRISPAQASALQKSRLDSRKTQGEIEAKAFDLAKNRHELYTKAVGALADVPNLNRDMVIQSGQQLVAMGIMPQELFDSGTANLPTDPEQLRAVLKTGIKQQLTPEQMFTIFAPKVTPVDNGQQIFRVDDNPNSPTFGQKVGAPAVQKMQSPESVASVGASLENAAATRDVAQSNRDAATIQTNFQNESGLRKEFEGLPEVKNYKQAYPAFAAVKDAASRNTPQSDINLVYGIAKVYDPNSVVREGEYATVANSPNIPERIKGYAQYLAGGGKLSPATKAQIVAEAEGRLATYKAEAGKARTSYEGIAKRRGIDPANVFSGMGDMVDAPAGFKYVGKESK